MSVFMTYHIKMWIINKMDNFRDSSHLISVNRLHICDKTKLSCSFPVLKAQIWREKERAGSETNDKMKGPAVGLVHIESAFQ